MGYIDVNMVVTRLQIKGEDKFPKHNHSYTEVLILKFVFPKELVKILKIYDQTVFPWPLSTTESGLQMWGYSSTF